MSELTTSQKNRVDLDDYDYGADIAHRIFLSSLTFQEVEVIEEILYSSLKIPLTLLEKNLGLTKKVLMEVLEKLLGLELFSIHEEFVLVNKEMRKYYEGQMVKFEEEFTPNIDYFQTLLRKVPIHVLPSWYSISRSSDNIFDSILEKYLLTPHIFERYLLDLSFSHPIEEEIVKAVYEADQFEVEVSKLLDQLGIDRVELEKYLLKLEFQLACCVHPRRSSGVYKEYVTPFYEWHQYLLHKTEAALVPIPKEKKVKVEESIFSIEKICFALTSPSKCPFEQLSYYVKRLSALDLATWNGKELKPTQGAKAFLNLNTEDKALFLYKEPQSALSAFGVEEELLDPKVIRAAEGAFRALPARAWVSLEDFLEGVCVSLCHEHQIILSKSGRTWSYALPRYTLEEKKLFRLMASCWLVEVGAISLGSLEGKECICLTHFGEALFGTE